MHHAWPHGPTLPHNLNLDLDDKVDVALKMTWLSTNYSTMSLQT